MDDMDFAHFFAAVARDSQGASAGEVLMTAFVKVYRREYISRARDVPLKRFSGKHATTAREMREALAASEAARGRPQSRAVFASCFVVRHVCRVWRVSWSGGCSDGAVLGGRMERDCCHGFVDQAVE